MNTVQLIGRLTRDPDLRTTKSGNDVCDFRIAVPRRRRDGESSGAAFIDVAAFGAQAIATAMPLTKDRQSRGYGQARAAGVDGG
jgi:single-strand DNA-binding protein